MLKVEGSKRGGEVSLHIRSKKWFGLSRQMLFGLGAAAALHVLGFVLVSFPILKLSQPVPSGPTWVEAELPTSGTSATALVSQQTPTGPLPDDVLMPKSTHPLLPSVTARHSPTSLKAAMASEYGFPTFNVRKNVSAPAPLEIEALSPQIHVFVSGPLATQILNDDGIATTMHALDALGIEEEIALQYDVLCDSKTGQICWHTRSYSDALLDADTPHSKLATEILTNMRFAANTAEMLSSGHIEIVFSNREYLD